MKKQRYNRDDITRIVDALMDADIDPALRAKMRLWFFSDKDVKRKQDAFVRYADRLEPYVGELGVDLRESYNRLAVRLGLKPIQGDVAEIIGAVPSERKPRRSRPLIWARVAAVFIPVLLVLGGWLFTHGESTDRELFIARAQYPQAMFLPDSTHISVASGSAAHYKESADMRSVELSGEAFFKVRRDTLKPFHVSTGNLRLRVLGTHFNIADHEGSASCEVSLMEGSVNVSTGGTENTLARGERLTYAPLTGEVSIAMIPASEMISQGYKPRLKFDHATLGEVLDALSAFYEVDVEFAPEMDRAAGDLTVNMEGMSLEESLDLLRKITQIL